MIKSIATIAVLLLLALPAIASTPDVPRYGKFEGAFTIPGQTGDPFDPSVNDVDVAFTGPRLHVTVPAFWDGGGWKVRYAPLAIGNYSATVTRNGQPCSADWSTAHTFHCTKSDSAGYVRRGKVVQSFAFDDGSTFYPLGVDQAWWPNDDGQHYVDAFAKMKGAGMRWARVWMTFWDNKALEWTASGPQPPIGDFSLDNARKLDKVVDAAERDGVYVQLVLQHHGQYTKQVDPNWNQNPYNVANGGFLQEPQDFFTDPRARTLTKAKYRYIVARWGYSTNIMSFELFNEVQNIVENRPNFGAVVDWHKEMAAYIRSIDVDHHLVTVSYSDPGNELSNIGLDYLQIHNYVPDVISYFAGVDYSGAQSPAFVGEWGTNGRQTEQSTHDGIWSSLMTNGAAPGMFWYWDQVDANDWYPVYASASDYLTDLGVGQQSTKIKLMPSSTSDTRAPLQFAMSGGWATTTSFSVDIHPDGAIDGLSGISSFIQGSGHRDMTAQPIVFHLHAVKPTRLTITLGTLSASGCHIQMGVDGVNQVDQTFPGTGKDSDAKASVGVDVPAGDHDVSLFNLGPDWFTVRGVSVADYAPALAALARTDGKTIDFWVYDRDRNRQTPIDGTLTFHVDKDGTYTVRLWDTWNSKELPSIEAIASESMLTIPINGLTRDWAGVAIPASK